MDTFPYHDKFSFDTKREGSFSIEFPILKTFEILYRDYICKMESSNMCLIRAMPPGRTRMDLMCSESRHLDYLFHLKNPAGTYPFRVFVSYKFRKLILNDILVSGNQ